MNANLERFGRFEVVSGHKYEQEVNVWPVIVYDANDNPQGVRVDSEVIGSKKSYLRLLSEALKKEGYHVTILCSKSAFGGSQPVRIKVVAPPDRNSIYRRLRRVAAVGSIRITGENGIFDVEVAPKFLPSPRKNYRSLLDKAGRFEDKLVGTMEVAKPKRIIQTAAPTFEKRGQQYYPVQPFVWKFRVEL